MVALGAAGPVAQHLRNEGLALAPAVDHLQVVPRVGLPVGRLGLHARQKARWPGVELHLRLGGHHHAQHVEVVRVVVQEQNAPWPLEEGKCQSHWDCAVAAGRTGAVVVKGRSIMKTAPRPGSECTLMRPCAPSTTFLQNVSPSPLPAPACEE